MVSYVGRSVCLQPTASNGRLGFIIQYSDIGKKKNQSIPIKLKWIFEDFILEIREPVTSAHLKPPCTCQPNATIHLAKTIASMVRSPFLPAGNG